MASVVKQPSSRYWIAAFRDSCGRQHRRTTRETDRKRAQAVAEQLERVAKRRGSPQRVRQIFAEFYRDHYGQDLPFSSVHDYIHAWLAARKPEVSPLTFGRYEDAARKFLSFLGPVVTRRGLDEISRSQILAFRDSLLARLASTTANVELKIIKRIFRTARQDSYLLQDPAEAVKTIRNCNTSPGRRAFSLPELRSILAVADPEWQSLIRFGLYTGQRLGDLAGSPGRKSISIATRSH